MLDDTFQPCKVNQKVLTQKINTIVKSIGNFIQNLKKHLFHHEYLINYET